MQKISSYNPNNPREYAKMHGYTKEETKNLLDLTSGYYSKSNRKYYLEQINNDKNIHDLIIKTNQDNEKYTNDIPAYFFSRFKEKGYIQEVKKEVPFHIEKDFYCNFVQNVIELTQKGIKKLEKYTNELKK